MSFLKGLFGKDSQAQPTQPMQQPVQSTTEIKAPSLEKVNAINLRKETLKICLEKKNMQNTVARVAVVMDQSGSMRGMYKDGKVQELIERLLPIAIKFDDNGELDMWLFATNSKRIDGVTEKDFDGYINRLLQDKNNNLWGTTKYAPPINDVIKKYTKEDPSNIPTYVIFITDGQNDSDDKKPTTEAITQAAKHNIFWQFVGIGGANFEYLRKLDELDGRVIDNANFFEINDLSRISDEELYNRLLNEYPSWEKEARSKGILK